MRALLLLILLALAPACGGEPSPEELQCRQACEERCLVTEDCETACVNPEYDTCSHDFGKDVQCAVECENQSPLVCGSRVNVGLCLSECQDKISLCHQSPNCEPDGMSFDVLLCEPQ